MKEDVTLREHSYRDDRILQPGGPIWTAYLRIEQRLKLEHRKTRAYLVIFT